MKNKKSLNPKVAVPIILFTFVFSLVIDNGFKFMSKPIADDLHLSATTVSLQATLAGIVIGIGAVVYAALADTFSIKKLLYVGIGLAVGGSVIGFVFQHSWPMVLIGRIIQTTGLAGAETLYVIYVTKHIPAKDQKTYLGFSTAAFQLAMLIGVLTSGFVSDYISWPAMFLVAAALILAVPLIAKTVPDDEKVSANLDVIGLLLIGVIGTSAVVFIQQFRVLYAAMSVAGVVLFAVYIRVNKNALVRPEFFLNGRYVWALVVVLILYSVQLGYIVFFPFIVSKLYGLGTHTTSMLIAPGYACATAVGAASGVIAKVVATRPAIMMALVSICGALVIPAIMPDVSVWLLIISMMFFGSGFALMYAPLMASAIKEIPAEKTGVAIGFYNLTINIAIPVGIAYTAKLIDIEPTFFSGLTVGSGHVSHAYGTVLWILAAIVAVAFFVYVLSDRYLTWRDHRRRGVVASGARGDDISVEGA
ncbi:MFS transporter [Corynebacterium kroppenstedtii]|uniref:MFS transporter n=1 Tax=Corynebacterium sp. PCR 32 TaxID=3351342 RepID=UPI0030A71CF6